MQTSAVRGVWPRAESKLYEEPRKLVARGLATARVERRGGRTRTVYRITAEGRRALDRWLRQPGAGAFLEFEAALKVIHADYGRREELRAQLDRIRADAYESRQAIVRTLRDIAAHGPALPERAATHVLIAKLGLEVQAAVEGWAAWAERLVAAWPADPSTEGPAVVRAILAAERDGRDAPREEATARAAPDRRRTGARASARKARNPHRR